ncbi:MAG: prephenate dehydrogenase [Acholeplasmataceae bacterium]
MKVFVVGLGLMGASYAEKLSQQGHVIYGYDIDKQALNKGQEQGFIQQNSDLQKLMISDVIILALYPDNTVSFIEDHQHLFKSGALVTDINGVKKNLIQDIERILRKDIRYVSHHPMAGRAKRGFDSKDTTIFNNNHFLIVETPRAKETDYELLRIIAKQLGFKTMTTITSDTHDEVIAYTSQLTHVIASALMIGHQEIPKTLTGDSFRDLTRIANINEMLWSELFLNNKTYLIEAISAFKEALNLIESFIVLGDEKGLKKVLKEARQKREDFENHS